MEQFKLVDLFAGTGAFSLAFENTHRVNTIFVNDCCKNSEKIYNTNFRTRLTLNDINEIDIETIPHMDILTAGFPCQPFSIAGRREGFNDPRSNVFWTIINIIERHHPKVVLFENVKNLQTHDKGITFRTITNELTRLNYLYKYKILNTCKYSNIPQNRERIYIVCFSNQEQYDRFEFPTEINERLTINDMLEQNIDAKYYYTDNSSIWNKLVSDVTENVNTNTVYQYRRYYVRKNKNNVCPTLTANMGTGGHNVPIIKDNNGIRKLTPRECFNLQGFPRSYRLPIMSDASLYKLAGNAVSYPVVKNIAQKIIDVLF